jgi:hypothetical protein
MWRMPTSVGLESAYVIAKSSTGLLSERRRVLMRFMAQENQFAALTAESGGAQSRFICQVGEC